VGRRRTASRARRRTRVYRLVIEPSRLSETLQREGEKEAGMTGSPSSTSNHGSVSASISNMMVRLVSEYTGRGPTKARTYFDGDLVSIVLQDTLTRGERSLVRDGRSELVLSTRRAYQDTMSDDAVAGIEELTGRKVLAFLSDNHIDPDVAVESFVLEPENGS
jgi:uncharacterized protein YbcI